MNWNNLILNTQTRKNKLIAKLNKPKKNQKI